MPEVSNHEPTKTPSHWRVAYEFAQRAIVGLLIFAVVALSAVALSYFIQLLEARHVDKVVVYGLTLCEFLLFAADITLLIVFVVGDVIRTVRQLLSSQPAVEATEAPPPVESYFALLRKATAPASNRKDPFILSYLALRRIVGYLALGLPFILAVPWWFFAGHALESSISGYYYTGMRDAFVGSLCAIAMFQVSCLGYDLRDQIAGTFSGVCALGVAFFPTTPATGATYQQKDIGVVHYTFAALLFLTLTYFCLKLFKLTTPGTEPTRQKRQRNIVYTVCGYVILTSLLMIVILKWLDIAFFGELGTVFVFETTSLLAFGTAWLVKGETFLKDEIRLPPRIVTSHGHVAVEQR